MGLPMTARPKETGRFPRGSRPFSCAWTPRSSCPARPGIQGSASQSPLDAEQPWPPARGRGDDAEMAAEATIASMFARQPKADERPAAVDNPLSSWLITPMGMAISPRGVSQRIASSTNTQGTRHACSKRYNTGQTCPPCRIAQRAAYHRSARRTDRSHSGITVSSSP